MTRDWPTFEREGGASRLTEEAPIGPHLASGTAQIAETLSTRLAYQ